MLYEIAGYARKQPDGFNTMKALALTNRTFYNVTKPIMWSTIDRVRDGKKPFNILLRNTHLRHYLKRLDFSFHNYTREYHLFLKSLVNLTHLDLQIWHGHALSLNYLFDALSNCQKLSHVQLISMDLPFTIGQTMLPRLPAYQTIKTFVIDIISIEKLPITYEHFFSNNYPVLTTLALGTERSETVNFIESGGHMPLNMVFTIPVLSNITTLCLEIMPANIFVLDVFLALPFLKTISITRILNCPSVFDSVVLPCLQHARGELAFINALIPTHNLQSIHTYFGSTNLVQQFLKAASGKSIKQFYYEAHLVAPGYAEDIVDNDIAFIKGIIHNDKTNVVSFNILVDPDNLVSNLETMFSSYSVTNELYRKTCACMEVYGRKA